MEQRHAAGVGSLYVEDGRRSRSRVRGAILLARHGSHEEVGLRLSGRSDIPLSDQGRAEAARLADRLDSLRLAALHSSPRRRARETAAVVAERQGNAVELADALDEIDFGAWTGASFAALADDPNWQWWNRQRATAGTPGGEDMSAATARAVRHIDNIEKDGPVLCVSHCDVIRGVVAHYLGLSADRLLPFDCDPGSLTTLAPAHDGARLVTLNERPI